MTSEKLVILLFSLVVVGSWSRNAQTGACGVYSR